MKTTYRNLRNAALLLAGFAVPLAAYMLLMDAGLPRDVARLVAVGYLLPAVLAVAAVAALDLPSRFRHAVALTVVLVWFGAALASLWETGGSSTSFLGGLLPYSDAAGYTDDAHALANEGKRFSEFSTRRPLFASMLASFLFITRNSLQGVQVLSVLFVSTGFYLGTVQVRRYSGRIAAIVFLLVCFCFYRRFIGTTLTEHLGLAAGSLAVALLWRGAFRKEAWSVYGGLFVLGLGLCARAGAMFVLPALIPWAAFTLRKQGRFPFLPLALATAAVASAFFVNALLGKVVSSPNATQFNNFSYTAYGLVTGGNWTNAANIYGGDSEAVMEATIAHVKEKPFSLVKGIFRAWVEFFLSNYQFAYVGSTVLRDFLILSALVGLGASIMYWRTYPGALLLLCAYVGIGLSVPFAPPWDADGMRAYATTIPLLALLAGFGSHVAMEAVRTLRKREAGASLVASLGRSLIPGGSSSASDRSAGALGAYAAALVVFAIVIPVGLRVIPDRQESKRLRRREGLDTVSMKLSPGSFLRLTGSRANKKIRFPNVRARDFREGLAIFAMLYPDEAKALRAIPRRTVLAHTWDGSRTLVLKWRKLDDLILEEVPVRVVQIGGMTLRVEEGVEIPGITSASDTD